MSLCKHVRVLGCAGHIVCSDCGRMWTQDKWPGARPNEAHKRLISLVRRAVVRRIPGAAIIDNHLSLTWNDGAAVHWIRWCWWLPSHWRGIR